MESKPTILLLDDEAEFLELYEDLLRELPSRPQVKTTTSGSRALAIIESEPIRLFICDLKMPKMDGLQVLSIVRRRFPDLNTVVLTSLNDEHFRSRAYALGVDMYWQKPSTDQETRMFLECMESILVQPALGGFRGVQNKSLVDIIQLECLSHSSSVLRVTNGPLTAKLWIDQGEMVDAEVEELRGEAAFHRILSWKTGAFEILPPEPTRHRTIERSYSALLLESAQAIDESTADGTNKGGDATPLEPLNGTEGVEFAVLLKSGDKRPIDSQGLEEPNGVCSWTCHTLKRFRELGETMQLGQPQLIEARGPQRGVGMGQCAKNRDLCVGWVRTLEADELREKTKKLLATWES